MAQKMVYLETLILQSQEKPEFYGFLGVLTLLWGNIQIIYENILVSSSTPRLLLSKFVITS